MPQTAVLKSLLLGLVAAALVLPIVVVLLLGLAGLGQAGGDGTGTMVLGWIARGVGLVWLLDLVCLVLVLALDRLLRDD